jgi:hypothetical protein
LSSEMDEGASIISLMMEAVNISVTLVRLYQTTQRYILLRHLPSYRRENLKSHRINFAFCF